MLRVIFFGRLAEMMGRERDVSLGSAATVGDLFDRLASEDADLRAALAATRVRFAVNNTIAPASQKINDGDEVAVLPPFSGG
jgi:molybdopterin converting factor subunit 1